MSEFKELKHITKGEIVLNAKYSSFKQIITDSRQLFSPESSLFVAIRGERNNGHDYLKQVYEKGIRQFIVEDKSKLDVKDANVLIVQNSLETLQKIAKTHRQKFSLPVVGITGSNGKTIVKEWLYQMVSPYKTVVKSPHSYNSQLGVPLSVWQISSSHDLGIFEAGISKISEMSNLEAIIKPDIGIFTNIGSAHAAGFKSLKEKVKQKAILFKNSNSVVYCKDHTAIDVALSKKGYTWGEHPDSDLRIVNKSSYNGTINISLAQQEGAVLNFTMPFSDDPSFENAMHCICLLKLLHFDQIQIQSGLNRLRAVPMRLALKKAVGNSYLIDDTYNNDLGGLRIALNFLVNQKQHDRKVLILSDLFQSGMKKDELYKEVSRLTNAANVDLLIGIGHYISSEKGTFKDSSKFYQNTGKFIKASKSIDLTNSVILVKGARSFEFEKIVQSLEEQIHATRLEINLEAVVHNFNYYKSLLNAGTKIMVMVKAFGYGAGAHEVANLLQYHNVDYLGVAYTDEGVALRQNGIRVPIMVMNPTPDAFDKIIEFNLEPEIYSFSLLENFTGFLNGRSACIHLKFDTGMNRLGFDIKDTDHLIQKINDNPQIKIRGIFSHLAGSDTENHNAFSHGQAALFKQAGEKLETGIGATAIKHLLNSSGIIRFPEYHFDMVRLGIGLYGLESNGAFQQKLLPVSRLKTTISQIKKIKKGQTVGYGRAGVALKDLTSATIAIGYADGFPRILSNGLGEVMVNGKKAQVLGNVCMDMTMINITNIEAQEGDEVEIFNDSESLISLANKLETIPYEVLTNISQRVKRVYVRG